MGGLCSNPNDADTAVPRQQKKADEPHKKVLIIGAAGAIGKQLTIKLLEKNGSGSVIAALRKTPLDDLARQLGVVEEFGVDLTNEKSVDDLIQKYQNDIGVVWNLAAPLSVETANDPSVAEDVTVKGFERLIKAMDKANLPESTKICFSDSIGSYGRSAPRDEATADWLVFNPNQDPGSDYGKQKRTIRGLLKASKYDTRWAVIPGVLHSDKTWGAGTTEYALDMILHAFQKKEYVCPINADMHLPMIYTTDLITGLIALQDAEKEALKAPDQGYTMAGFSFTPFMLATMLEKVFKGNSELITYKPEGAAKVFSECWPDSLSNVAALRDLNWQAKDCDTVHKAIQLIVQGHGQREKNKEREEAGMKAANSK